MQPLKVVITYEGGLCPHCNVSTKNVEILHTDEDRASLYRARQKLKQSAMTIALTCQRIYYERGIRVPKPYVRDMIHWSAGANFYRPLKQNKTKYACGCIAHTECSGGSGCSFSMSMNNKYTCPKHNKYFDGFITNIGATLRYSFNGDTSPLGDVSPNGDTSPLSRKTPWIYE